MMNYDHLAINIKFDESFHLFPPSQTFAGQMCNFPCLLPSDLHIVVHYQIKLNGHATVVHQSLPKMYEHVVDGLDRFD